VRVTIVGAGLIGLTTALRLYRAGAEVTLLERGVVGSGAARGNAGQICPDQATPVAKSSLILSALTQLYRQDSALHVDPGTLPGYAPFLMRIARNSLPGRYARNQAGLKDIETLATHAFLDLAADIGVEVSDAGYLHVYDTAAAAQAGRAHELERMAASTLPHEVSEVVDAAGLQAIEPALRGTGFGFLDAGSYFTNPNHYVDALERELRAGGATIHEGTTVTAVTDEGDVRRVHTSRGDFAADAVVIAAGIGSAQVGAASGYRMPMRAGKGYSFTVDAQPATEHVMIFESAHVVSVPLDGATRIAGTMEFDGDTERFNARRIDQIVAGVSPYLDPDTLAVRRDEWVGSRPLTPDGLPVIDRVPGLENTWMASGHNMLGLMFAPFTAGLLVDMVIGGHSLRHRQFAASRPF
jgi:D-amino-acid dehydrogenase